jgi:hypothetical protein
MRYSPRERNGPLQSAAADWSQPMLHFGFRPRLILVVIWPKTPTGIGSTFSRECARSSAKLLKFIAFTG